MLVVVSGLPAVGKSELSDALGRRMGAAVLSVDPIEAAILRCGIPRSFETGVAAYEVAAVLAEQADINISSNHPRRVRVSVGSCGSVSEACGSWSSMSDAIR